VAEGNGARARMRAGGPRTRPTARGRVWDGVARTQGHGETGVPHIPARGRIWEGYALPATTFSHPVGVRRSRIDGCKASFSAITCPISHIFPFGKG